MIFITLQYVLFATLVGLVLWCGYFVSFPAIEREKEVPFHKMGKGVVHSIELLQVICVVVGWWSVPFSFLYYAADWIINLLPTILLGCYTIVVVANLTRRLTPHVLIAYGSFIGPFLGALGAITSLDLTILVIPFFIFLATLAGMELARRRSPRANTFLDQVLVEKVKFYRWCTSVWFTGILIIVMLVELLFQLEGLSLLKPVI